MMGKRSAKNVIIEVSPLELEDASRFLEEFRDIMNESGGKPFEHFRWYVERHADPKDPSTLAHVPHRKLTAELGIEHHVALAAVERANWLSALMKNDADGFLYGDPSDIETVEDFTYSVAANHTCSQENGFNSITFRAAWERAKSQAWRSPDPLLLPEVSPALIRLAFAVLHEYRLMTEKVVWGNYDEDPIHPSPEYVTNNGGDPNNYFTWLNIPINIIVREAGVDEKHASAALTRAGRLRDFLDANFAPRYGRLFGEQGYLIPPLTFSVAARAPCYPGMAGYDTDHFEAMWRRGIDVD